jgi:hypothetical protein
MCFNILFHFKCKIPHLFLILLSSLYISALLLYWQSPLGPHSWPSVAIFSSTYPPGKPMDYSTSASISIFFYISPDCFKFCCCIHATTFSQSISTMPSFYLLSTGKLLFMIPPDVIRSSPFIVSPCLLSANKIWLSPLSLSLEIYR